MCVIKRNGESELEQKLLAPASGDNGIITDVVAVVTVFKLKFNYCPVIWICQNPTNNRETSNVITFRIGRIPV